jgi:hypothetical protein
MIYGGDRILSLVHNHKRRLRVLDLSGWSAGDDALQATAA